MNTESKKKLIKRIKELRFFGTNEQSKGFDDCKNQ